MYKHQRLLQENVVDMATFPTPIQNMIALFAEQEYELEEAEGRPEENSDESDTEELRTLRRSLKELDHTLYKNIKSFIDQEVSEELTGAELKEAILSEFYREGSTNPPIKALRQAGYPLANVVRLNEKAGNYRLVKRRYDSTCTILPLS